MRNVGRQLFRLAENNDDSRPEQNGEQWLLRELLRSHQRRPGTARPFVLIDGGANLGDYTSLARDQARRIGCSIHVHAFEPSPYCAAKLRGAFAGAGDVHIVAAAVGDRDGEMLLHDGATGSSHASLVAREKSDNPETDAIRVPVRTLGDYLGAAPITRVDLLKLDVEGFELAALRGLADRLNPEVIDAIQFEYGGTALDAGTTLRELYCLLSSRGYLLAKLFPAALEIRDYRAWMEHYAFANYVALSPRWRAEGQRTR